MTKNTTKRFFKDERGVSAIEFALILPVLNALLFGTISIYDMTRAKNSVVAASATLAELIARDDVVSNQDVENAFEAARAMVRLENPGVEDVTVRVANVEYTNQRYTIAWHDEKGVAAFTDNNLQRLDIPMDHEYGSVIISEVSFHHEPTFRIAGLTDGILSNLTFRQPVNVEFINRDRRRIPDNR